MPDAPKSAPTREGWWFPLNSRKAHYIVGTVSLCKKWGCWGHPKLEAHTAHSKDDCVACERLRAERVKKHAPTETGLPAVK